jgi:hypothetical protein
MTNSKWTPKKTNSKRTPKKSRTQLKKDLQKVINSLVTVPCSFWACPGPNRQFVNMATCKVCSGVKELRRIRDEI